MESRTWMCCFRKICVFVAIHMVFAFLWMAVIQTSSLAAKGNNVDIALKLQNILLHDYKYVLV